VQIKYTGAAAIQFGKTSILQLAKYKQKISNIRHAVNMRLGHM